MEEQEFDEAQFLRINPEEQESFFDKKRKRESPLVFTIKVIMLIVSVFNIFVFTAYYRGVLSRAHRYADTDKDGVINMRDNDIDGDSIPNMKDPDANGSGRPNTEDMLRAARGMIGMPYEQLMGAHKNIGFKLGGIVCIDLVNLAYEKAGIYFERELRKFYKQKPYYFSYRKWNNPYDPDFARRVRNFRAYCRGKGFLLKKGEPLQPGDLVIFGQGHIAIIEKVKGDDYTVIEASGKKYFTMRASKKDIYERSLERYGDAVYARIRYE